MNNKFGFAQLARLSLITLLLFNCAHYNFSEEDAQYLNLSSDRKLEENSKLDTKLHKQIAQKNITSDLLLQEFAPQLKLFNANDTFNRVGKVIANDDGSVYIDSDTPVVYQHKNSFIVEDREYQNLIYRVHFSEIPFSMIPFHLSKGKNVGLIFIMTLNDKNQPILFTITHSCGCYKAIMATSYTPESFYPEKWLAKGEVDLKKINQKQKVYGEKLPHVLALSEEKPHVCISVKPQTHRVMDVDACNKNTTANSGVNSPALENHMTKHSHAQVQALTSLRQLPSTNGPVSFFHEEGVQEGFVKGAIKPWETLLLSVVSLDFFVGTDKAFLRPSSSENSFYTSIKPWNRTESDMANFSKFLNFWGWNL